MEGLCPLQLHRLGVVHRLFSHNSPRLVRDEVTELLAAECATIGLDGCRWIPGHYRIVLLPH